MKNILWTVVFVLCSGLVANAQTIADVARRERARRPPAQSSVTITNANLKKKSAVTGDEKKPGEGETPATAAATAAAPSVSEATQAPAAATTAAEEKAWRTKFEDTRTEIRRAENQVAVAQLELNSANRDYLTRSYDPDGRGPAAIAAATKKLDDANKSVAAGKAKLAQLEEELRRAGAPAGWAR